MYQATDLADALISQRFSHKRIDELFANPISADKDAYYAKNLFLNLSTLSPYVSGPNSVKIATPLKEYVVSSQIYTVSRVTKQVEGAKSYFVSYLSFRLALQFCCSSTNRDTKSEPCTDWQHRTSRSTNRIWYRARTVELQILLPPPESLGKPHLPKSLIR